MKIAFTSVKDKDIDFFKEQLKDCRLVFFKTTIDNIKIEDINDTDILCIFVFDKLTKDILSKFENLKLIITRSTGYDHIDIEYCRKHNIKVAHIPGYSPKSIAEHTLAMLLTLTRKIKRVCTKTKEMDFSQSEDIVGIDLDELSIGVIGTGRIGSWTAKLSKFLGMEVYAYDIVKNRELESMGVKYEDNLNELFEKSDVISLHVPYTPQTHHLINRDNIKTMKDGVILLNTSRGAVIDTDAIYDAIKSGKILAAGLDVFEDEDILILNRYEKGNSSDKALKILKLSTLDNVIITPHIAYYTQKAINNIRKYTVECIKLFIGRKSLDSFEVV